MGIILRAFRSLDSRDRNIRRNFDFKRSTITLNLIVARRFSTVVRTETSQPRRLASDISLASRVGLIETLE